MADSSGSHTPLSPAALVDNRISEKRLFEARFLFDKFSGDIDPALGVQLQQRLTAGISKAEQAFNAGEQAERDADLEKARLAYVEVAALAVDYPGLAEVRQRVALALQLGSLLSPKPVEEASAPDPLFSPAQLPVEPAVQGAVDRVSFSFPKVVYILSCALLGMLGLVVAWIYYSPVHILDLAGRFIPAGVVNRSGESGSDRSLSPAVGEQMTTLSAVKQLVPASPLLGVSGLDKLPEKEPATPELEVENKSEDASQVNDLEGASQPVQSVGTEENLESSRGEIQQSIIPPLVPVFEPATLPSSAGFLEIPVTPIQNSWKKSVGLQKQEILVKEKRDEVPENDILKGSKALPAHPQDVGYNENDHESDRICSEDVGLSLELQLIGLQKVGNEETTQAPLLQDAPSFQDSWKETIFVLPDKHVKKKNASVVPTVFLEAASNGTVGIAMDDISSDSEAQKERPGASANLVPGKPVPEGTEKYIVCSGDTLETISSTVYGDSYKWPYLVMANRDKLGPRPYVLPVGLELDVPAPEEERGIDLLNDDGTYTVQTGDSLGSIARKMYGNSKEWNSLYRLNRDLLRSPGSLEAGQVLRVNKEHLLRRKAGQSSYE